MSLAHYSFQLRMVDIESVCQFKTVLRTSDFRHPCVRNGLYFAKNSVHFGEFNVKPNGAVCHSLIAQCDNYTALNLRVWENNLTVWLFVKDFQMAIRQHLLIPRLWSFARIKKKAARGNKLGSRGNLVGLVHEIVVYRLIARSFNRLLVWGVPDYRIELLSHSRCLAFQCGELERLAVLPVIYYAEGEPFPSAPLLWSLRLSR